MTTEGSLLRIDSKNRQAREMASGASLVFLEWVQPQVLAGLTPGGSVYVSRDDGRTWRPAGHLGAAAQALDVSGMRWLAATATSEGVFESVNRGRTWTAAVRQAG